MSTNITTSTQSSNLSKLPELPQEVREQVQNCIANGKIPFSPEAIYTMIKNRISGGDSKSITPLDVVEVLKTAVSAGIDPTSNDIFAFKSRGNITVGISKKGWSKILDNRKGSVEYEYGPIIKGQTTRHPVHYEYVAAKITRADGSFVTGPRVYYDEFNTDNGAWRTNPKTMMTVRAFTQACAIAYGIGAYDEDEAKEIYDKSNSSAQVDNTNVRRLDTRAALPLPSSSKETDNIFEALEQDRVSKDIGKIKDIAAHADSVETLNAAFIKLPAAWKEDSEIVQIFKERKQEILTKFEDL